MITTRASLLHSLRPRHDVELVHSLPFHLIVHESLLVLDHL